MQKDADRLAHAAASAKVAFDFSSVDLGDPRFLQPTAPSLFQPAASRSPAFRPPPTDHLPEAVRARRWLGRQLFGGARNVLSGVYDFLSRSPWAGRKP